VAGTTSRLAGFLATELAPTPGRGRATLRIVAASVLATILVMGFHVPEGHWAIMTIFTVSQADAGASLRRGVQRVLGTILGGSAGIVLVNVFADQPWIRLPLFGTLGAVGLFLFRTTTAPYVGFLAGITGLMVVAAARGPDPSGAIVLGLWRIALIAASVLLAVGAQLLLWPDDPEEELLAEIGARVDAAAQAVRRCVGGTPRADAPPPSALVESGLVRHLDLLANAEARYPSLRLRHVEQITLIGAVEHLLTGALALERAAAGVAGPMPPPTVARLAALGADCDRLRDALVARRPPAAARATERPTDEAVAMSRATGLLPAVLEMERALGEMEGALGFLGNPRLGPDVSPARLRSPLDAPAAG